MLPTSDHEALADFRNDFRVKRQGESGLSILVPWYEISGDDSMTPDKVTAAVLKGAKGLFLSDSDGPPVGHHRYF